MCCFGHQVLCALQGIIQTINKGVEGFDEVFHLDGGMDTYGLEIGMGAPVERLLNGNQGAEGMADAQINHEQGQNDERRNGRSEEHTSELQSRGHLVCRLLLEK